MEGGVNMRSAGCGPSAPWRISAGRPGCPAPSKRSRPDRLCTRGVCRCPAAVWELATGERPYKGLNAARILHRVLLSGGRPALPLWLPPSYTRLASQCWAQVAVGTGAGAGAGGGAEAGRMGPGYRDAWQ